MVQIPPPTIRANIVKLSLASHPAEVKSPVRRAFVRQNHECKPVHAGHGRRLAPLTCAHVHPSRPAIEPISRYQYTPRRAERQAQFDYLCLLKLLPILTADQPIERRGRVYPCRVCDGGELCHIRQRVPRWVFPCLPCRSCHPDDLRRLSLTQTAKPPEVPKAALYHFSVIFIIPTGEKRSFCIQFGHPLKKIVSQFAVKAPRPRFSGLLPLSRADSDT